MLLYTKKGALLNTHKIKHKAITITKLNFNLLINNQPSAISHYSDHNLSHNQTPIVAQSTYHHLIIL